MTHEKYKFTMRKRKWWIGKYRHVPSSPPHAAACSTAMLTYFESSASTHAVLSSKPHPIPALRGESIYRHTCLPKGLPHLHHSTLMGGHSILKGTHWIKTQLKLCYLNEHAKRLPWNNYKCKALNLLLFLVSFPKLAEFEGNYRQLVKGNNYRQLKISLLVTV